MLSTKSCLCGRYTEFNRNYSSENLFLSILFRISKSGEQNISNEEIRSITEKIEEEMFRVYGKVDNSYKNKFRSLLANISNMTNNVKFVLIFNRTNEAHALFAFI